MKIDIRQISFIDQKLRGMLLWLEEKTGMEFTITSIYRDKDKGVHGTIPVRGIDLRCRSIDIGVSVENLINSHWQYDPKRPVLQCCLLHGEGLSLHLHCQVHKNTEFKEDGYYV